MTRVDSHQHFWAPSRGDYFWMSPDDPVLARPFRPADLFPLIASHAIDTTVLVQAAPSIEETEYMLGIADATPWVAGVVGWIDFEDPGHRRHLERFSRHPKFLGVRPMIQDIPDDDWMLRADLDWAFQALIDLDVTFDALGFPRHLANFLTLFNRYPGLRAVIDHCMKPQIRDRSFDQWAAGMRALAEDTSAFCKLSGIVTEATPDWTVEDLGPYTSLVLESFGPDRVMWGSDWPVATLASSYDRWVDAAEQLTADLDATGKASIFGETAMRFYRLGQ